MEVEPTFADERVRVSLGRGIGDECEDFEEELVGEEKGFVGENGESVVRFVDGVSVMRRE